MLTFAYGSRAATLFVLSLIVASLTTMQLPRACALSFDTIGAPAASGPGEGEARVRDVRPSGASRETGPTCACRRSTNGPGDAGVVTPLGALGMPPAVVFPGPPPDVRSVDAVRIRFPLSVPSFPLTPPPWH